MDADVILNILHVEDTLQLVDCGLFIYRGGLLRVGSGKGVGFEDLL